jgi:tetratricopeptide (TPR) repeat protein
MADKPSSETKPTATAVPGVNPAPVKHAGTLLDRILPHMKKILVTIAVVTVVLTVIFTRRWWIERGEQKQTFQLAEVLQVASEPVRAKGDTADPKNPTFADDAERANAVLTAAAAHDVELPPAYKAGLLLDTGKLDEAIAAYRTGIGLPEPEGVVAREGLGIALEQKATAEKDATARQRGFEDALLAYQSMQPDPAGARYAYGQYHVGRILVQLHKLDEAKAAFVKAKEAAKGSTDMLPELIEKRLASLGAS